MRERRDILAVQTLRNSTMSASFMASTAVLLIIGVLTLSAQGDKLSGTWHALNFLGRAGAEMWLFKLLMMLFDLLFAFFSFSMSMRMFHHIGYLINVPLDQGVEAHPDQAGRRAAQPRRHLLPHRHALPTTSRCRCCSGCSGRSGCWAPRWRWCFFMFHLDRAPRHDTDLMG